MSNFPVLFYNQSGGIIGVKSEAWLELQLDGVDWIDEPNYYYCELAWNDTPNPGDYFQIKVKGVTYRFTFVPPANFEKQIIKTEYGYSISVLHPMNSDWSNILEALFSTFLSVTQLTQYYLVDSFGIFRARSSGSEWQFDPDTLAANDPKFVFSENIPSGSSIPENLMLAARLTLDQAKYDLIGRALPTVYARPQVQPDGSYSFLMRIDEVSLPELQFNLPQYTGPISSPDPLYEIIPGILKKFRLQGIQVSGRPPVAQQSYYSPTDGFIIRSGVSAESVKKWGLEWFDRLVIQNRSGVLSYLDPRVVIGHQKFLYLCAPASEVTYRVFAVPTIVDYFTGEETTLNQFNIVGCYVETAPDIISFSIGDTYADRLRNAIPPYIGGNTDFVLKSYHLYLCENSFANILQDLGEFICVQETFGSRCFYYENDLGGLSDVIFTGKTSSEREISKTEYHQLGYTPSLQAHRKFNHVTTIETPEHANSGAVSLSRLKEILEMLHSPNVWIRIPSGELMPVTINPGKFTIHKDGRDGVYLYSVTIQYSRAYNRLATALEDNVG